MWEVPILIWAFCIAADLKTPNPQGMVPPKDETEAFALIGDPDTNLYALLPDSA
ncbi:hypothetical protein ACX9MO_14770 [Pseudooceanicola sp. 502str34]